ncbi:hypothetical protein [Holospora elegans]|nr:hypothetical protein [Holospora elegans]
MNFWTSDGVETVLMHGVSIFFDAMKRSDAYETYIAKRIVERNKEKYKKEQLDLLDKTYRDELSGINFTELGGTVKVMRKSNTPENNTILSDIKLTFESYAEALFSITGVTKIDPSDSFVKEKIKFITSKEIQKKQEEFRLYVTKISKQQAQEVQQPLQKKQIQHTRQTPPVQQVLQIQPKPQKAQETELTQPILEGLKGQQNLQTQSQTEFNQQTQQNPPKKKVLSKKFQDL